MEYLLRKKEGKIKRKHTLDLKEKIGAKAEQEHIIVIQKLRKIHPEKSEIKPDNVTSSDKMT